MKKIVILILLSIIASSCFGTACPSRNRHRHPLKNIKMADSITAYINCWLGRKICIINHVGNNDSVYVISNKSEKTGYVLAKKYGEDETNRQCRLKIGNASFHQGFSGDTIRIKVKKPNSAVKVYAFMAIEKPNNQ